MKKVASWKNRKSGLENINLANFIKVLSFLACVVVHNHLSQFARSCGLKLCKGPISMCTRNNIECCETIHPECDAGPFVGFLLQILVIINQVTLNYSGKVTSVYDKFSFFQTTENKSHKVRE